jgi:2-polyprenyl-3-methyl-5-hydroxy-6-metoxy-1,4-benzoquinol methylase
MSETADVDRYVERLIDTRPDGIVAAYRQKFAMSAALPLTAAMIRDHWRIERRATLAILGSDAAERARIVAQAYTEVFGRCPWLNQIDGGDRAPDLEFQPFATLLRGAQRVYEVGSGKGELITWLARRGFACVGTEITPERGAVHVSDTPGLEWHATDGVHLTRQETPGSYDALLSNQVLEHLHPDDIATHFAEAAALLKPGGRYVLATPHPLSGPADLSVVFGLDHPVCFHLKEYYYGELVPVLRRAGFARLRAVYSTPRPLKRYLNVTVASGLYLGALRGAEALLALLPLRVARTLVRGLHKLAIWRPDVFLVAETRR